MVVDVGMYGGDPMKYAEALAAMVSERGYRVVFDSCGGYITTRKMPPIHFNSCDEYESLIKSGKLERQRFSDAVPCFSTMDDAEAEIRRRLGLE